MIPWPWLIVPLFVGVTAGALTVGALRTNGPSALESLLHLGRLVWVIDNGKCDFRNGTLMMHNLDEGTEIATRVLDNARRFLDQYGEGEGV